MKLRPEVNEFKYWVHLFVISVIVLGIARLLGYHLFSVWHVVVLAILVGFSDVIAHSLLSLN